MTLSVDDFFKISELLGTIHTLREFRGEGLPPEMRLGLDMLKQFRTREDRISFFLWAHFFGCDFHNFWEPDFGVTSGRKPLYPALAQLGFDHIRYDEWIFLLSALSRRAVVKYVNPTLQAGTYTVEYIELDAIRYIAKEFAKRPNMSKLANYMKENKL